MRLTTSSTSAPAGRRATDRSMASAQSSSGRRRRYGSGSGSCGGPGTRQGASASRGVTQAASVVANDLPRNGPSGWYSHAWMSRADQSLSSAIPKTCSAARSVGTGRPGTDGTPTTAAT